MELEKNKISINQIVAQKLDTAICEGDCIVPDIKPDIYNIISSSGIVTIYKKEVMDGKVWIDGGINTYTIYSSEEDGKKEIRAINYVIDFSQIENIESAKNDQIAEVNTKLRSVEARIVNERKINVKAVLDFDIKLFANNSEEFITGINDIPDLQKLERKMTVNSMLGCAKTKAQVKETVPIDGVDNLTEILKVNIDITNRDTKISYNKILAKADSKLKILYLTEDGRICVVSATLPIMGFIDMENISEENVCDMQYEIRNLVIKPNSMQEHSIYVEAEIEITASCYETKEINTIEGIKRIRLGSLEPLLITQRFLNRLKKLEKICHHFHLSLQSGCDETLKRMNRRYTTEEFEKGVQLLRRTYPNVALTTDIIVGFPGETEEDFFELYEFVNRAKFERLGVFKYSKEDGTPASRLKNQIHPKTKQARYKRIMELEKQISKIKLEENGIYNIEITL